MTGLKTHQTPTPTHCSQQTVHASTWLSRQHRVASCDHSTLNFKNKLLNGAFDGSGGEWRREVSKTNGKESEGAKALLAVDYEHSQSGMNSKMEYGNARIRMADKWNA